MDVLHFTKVHNAFIKEKNIQISISDVIVYTVYYQEKNSLHCEVLFQSPGVMTIFNFGK